jgi:hypothetical protein
LLDPHYPDSSLKGDTKMKYKSKVKLHIGDTEEAISVGEVVEFNGSTIVREGGKEISLRNPSAFEGAIKSGWLVPLGDKTGTFKPKPAGVEVRSATATGETRAKVTSVTVQDEERDFGDIASIRQVANGGRGDVPPTRKAANASAVRELEDDAVVIGRFKSSAKAAPVEIGKDDERLKRALDNKASVEVERLSVTATGDVQEARVGDSLEDLLPEAATSGTPVRAKETLLERIRRALQAGELTYADLARLLPEAEGPTSEEGEDNEGQEEGAEPPPIEWDLSAHWKTRERIVQTQYAGNRSVLEYILSVDESTGVRKAVERLLESL